VSSAPFAARLAKKAMLRSPGTRSIGVHRLLF
jgi:hypothetical protein